MSDDNENGSDGEWDEKSDLTRIEDLSEFLHVEDDELNQKFEDADLSSDDEEEQLGEDLVGLGDLDDDPQGLEEEPPQFEEAAFGQSENEDDGDTTGSFGEQESFASSEDDEELETLETSEFDEATEPNLEIPVNENEFPNFEESDQELEESSSSEDQFSIEDENDFSSDNDDEQSENESLDENTGEYQDQEDSSFGESDSFEQGDSQEVLEDDGQWDSSQQFDTDQEDDEEAISEEPEDTDKTYQDLPEEPFDLPDPEDLEVNRQALAQELDHDAPPVSALTETQTTSPISSATRENFQDLREFGNSISYGLVQAGGNPPYSLIVRQLKYEEDARDILIILREHGLLTDENEETITQGLEQGSLLISQISEYSAVYLAHRLRRFDLDLRIGLSDQLHPSKSYNPENKGLVSKHNISQNFQEDVILEDRVVHIDDILMATTPSIEGYSIYRYLEVITSHTIINEDELKRISKQAKLTDTQSDSENEDSLDSPLYQELYQREPDVMDNYSLGINEIYHELSLELKNQAFKLEANAVVGINFALSPLISHEKSKGNTTYKITCSGNAVWVVDK